MPDTRKRKHASKADRNSSAAKTTPAKKTGAKRVAGRPTSRDRSTNAGSKGTCLLVLGMHRSGTSALTRVLSLMGAALPKRLLGASRNNKAGYWEPSRLVTYHDQMLAELGSAWHDWKLLDLKSVPVSRREAMKADIREILSEDYDTAPLIVVKEPRICRFASFFSKAVAEAGYDVRPIVTFRNPLEVIDSLVARSSNWPGTYDTLDAALLWLVHNLEAERASREFPRAVVSYDGLMRDWKKPLSAIARALGKPFANEPEAIKGEVSEFIDEGHRHHTKKQEDVLLDPRMAGWISDCYTALTALEAGRNTASAIGELDRIHAEFSGALPLLLQAVEARRGETEKKRLLDENLAKVRAEAEEKKAIYAEHAAVLEHERDASRVQAEALSAEVASAKEQIGHLESAAQAAQAQLKAAEEGMVRDRKIAQAAEARFSQAQAEITDLRREIAGKEKLQADERQTAATLHKSLTEELEAIHAGMRVQQEQAVSLKALLEEERAQNDAQISALKTTDVEKNAKISALESSSMVKQARIEHLEREAGEKAARITALEQDIEVRSRETQAVHARLQQVTEEFRNSTSWKLTAPLRAIKTGPRALARIARVAPEAIKSGGGIALTTGKFLRLFRTDGTKGIKNRIESVLHDVEQRENENKIQSEEINRSFNIINIDKSPIIYMQDKNDTVYKNKYKVLWVINKYDLNTQRYRVYNIANHIISKDFFSIFVNESDIDSLTDFYFDLVVINRIHFSDNLEKFLGTLKKKDIPVIFDIDDLVFDEEFLPLLREHSAPARRESMKNAIRLWRATMERADYVTVSTEALSMMAYREGKKAFVIPNNIPQETIEKATCANPVLQKKEGYTYIGYFSGTKTHSIDFLECKNALLNILRNYDKCFFVKVGELELPKEFELLSDKIIELPLQKYEDMLSILSGSDVVLAPLELGNAFTDCKSQLKLFEAAAFKIPCVASPVRSYLSSIIDGENGYLAEDDEEWERKIGNLVENKNIRKEMGEKAYETILPRHLSSSAGELAASTYKYIMSSHRQKEGRFDRKRIDNFHELSEKYCVSIIAPLYQKSKELIYFLDSIFYQNYMGRIELILIDDLCPDRSGDKARKYLDRLSKTSVIPNIDFKVIYNNENRGNCGARNAGLDVAHGRIVLVVDADGIFDQDSISEHVSAYEYQNCDVAIGVRGIETDGVCPLEKIAYMSVNPELAMESARFQDRVVPESFVNCVTRNVSFRREKYSDFRFDEDFSYTKNPESGFGWEDVEFGFRLYKRGAKFVFLKNSICLHYSHDSDLQNPNKPIKSLRNFVRLLLKHKELAKVAPGWSRFTSDAIVSWLKRFNHDLHAMQDGRDLKAAMSDIPKVFFRRTTKPLRILTHRWHCAHQFELYRLGHDFHLASGAGTKMCDDWEWRHRPKPENANFVDFEKIKTSNYDLLILHFDENMLHPEYCNGHVPVEWGRTAAALLEMSDELPVIAVCHGTPQFYGQYDPDYSDASKGRVIEESKAELVDLFTNIPVVCNSYQAEEEWQFRKSEVIWHGFSASNFPMGQGGAGVLAMEERKIRQRPYYNGWDVMEEVISHLGGEFPFQHLDFPSFVSNSYLEKLFNAERRFHDYSRSLGTFDIYLNTTVRSPMPRMRGEAMMTGCVPVSYKSHDVDRFISNGVNGFYSDSPEELSEMLKFLMRCESSLKDMRAAARRTALEEFSLDRYLREWSNLINATLG